MKLVTSTSGKGWVKYSELKAGMKVRLDGGFTCNPLCIKTVQIDGTGAFFVSCDAGHHFLDGQRQGDATLN